MRIVGWIIILLVGRTPAAVTREFVDRLADGPEGVAAIDKKRCCTLHTTQFPECGYISGTRGTARGVSGPLSHSDRVDGITIAKMGTSVDSHEWII